MRNALIPWLAAATLAIPAYVFAQETPPPPAVEPAPAPPEDPHKQAVAFYQRGMAAYQRKDYVGYLDNLLRAVELDPDQPAMRYRLACAHALVGNNAEMVAELKRLVDLTVYQDLVGNADFDAVRQDPAFQKVAEAMKALKDPITSSTLGFRLLEKDLITEGIAFDPVEGDFFVGSVHKRKILRSSKKGKTTVFAAAGQDGLGAVLGLRVDAARRLLWACSSGMPQMEGATEDLKGRAALHKYDLKTGALVAKHPLGDGAPGHNCNDLTIGPAGEVYVSDSESGEVLLLPAGGDRLEVLVATGKARSPQGLALSPDGKLLFVADYATTIHRVDLATREIAEVPAPDNLPMLGIDGLLFHRDGLVAIQNGIHPHRVVKLTLDPDLRRIVAGKILEMNNPLFDEPTLGTLAGKDLYYVANSQWGRFTPDGTIYPMNRLAEPVILRMKLD